MRGAIPESERLKKWLEDLPEYNYDSVISSFGIVPGPIKNIDNIVVRFFYSTKQVLVEYGPGNVGIWHVNKEGVMERPTGAGITPTDIAEYLNISPEWSAASGAVTIMSTDLIEFKAYPIDQPTP